ncbi:MAG: protein Mom [Bacteroidia bacterium]|nr:protein Mom [Bacteroidia bacterium]
MGKVDLKIDWATHEAAKYAVTHWHYSKSMPVNKTVKMGVWEDGAFVGAIIFSCGSAGVGSIGKSMGIKNTEIAELARVALKIHKTNVTRIVSIALSFLKKSQTKLRLIVSYADPEKGHIGSIYQAGNWVYVGRSKPDMAYIDGGGRRWHSRSVSESGYKIRCGVKAHCLKPSTMRAVKVEPKYKYFMPLDDEMRKQIEPLRKPYPKRDKQAIASYPDDSGGAAPTVTLHNEEVTL